MSSTGAEKLTTIFARLSGVRHAFRIPRGTLISSERLGSFAVCSFPAGRPGRNCALLLDVNEQGAAVISVC